MRRVVAGLAISWLAVAAPAAAAPLAPEAVPEPLDPWVDWVLRGHESERCPFLDEDGRRICTWPSRLELEVEGAGARFAQSAWVHHETSFPLPGDTRHWPLDVRVDGKPAAVTAQNGRPSVRLAAGAHQVSGRFRWDALPELLQVPPQTGIVRLRVDGRDVESADRDARGRLWLAARGRPEAAGDVPDLEVIVHRRVSDEVPLLLETRLELRVSGRNRELRLGRALPAGFEPLALSGPLPARLDPDAHLRVQVRPGAWKLTLLARHLGPVDALTLPEPDGPWDAQEEWVFEAHPKLRAVAIEDAVALDPSQTTLPAEWRRFPAYAMEPGRTLRLQEKRRGDTDPAADQLSLARILWLDFDGQGATASDSLSGMVRRSARLEMQPGIELGRVALDGVDQLITRIHGEARAGVGIPPGPIALSADSRIAHAGRGIVLRLPAVGWDADVDALRATLQLPPGWRLLHASGADVAPGTWLEAWTLLDLFAVLVLSLAFLRLWGPRWGALAAAGLALAWTERDAPQWIWAAVLAGEALLRVLPGGRVPRLRRAVQVYRAAALAALVMILIPFAARQLRSALHPALERPWAQPSRVHAEQAAAETEAAFSVPLEAGKRALPRAERLQLEALPADAGPSAPAAPDITRVPDPRASVTTGPGLPEWTWGEIELGWSGPVRRDQVLGLWLAPPAFNSSLAFARVALLAALLLPLLGRTSGGASGAPSGAPALLLVVALGASALPATARADFPAPELLEELRQRLLDTEECHPDCAEVSRLVLDLEPGALRMQLEVHARTETAVALPGGNRELSPRSVTIDGATAASLQRAANGVLWARVGPGVHAIVSEAALPDRDLIELALPSRPRRVEVRARGWTVQGIREDGMPEATLQLVRIGADEARAAPALEPGTLPPFVRVVRTLQLGLDWQASTVVERLSPADLALALEVPLLPGESITSPEVRSAEGRARVAMAPGVRSVAWSSSLAQQPEIVLRATREDSVSEVWRLDASLIWHIEVDGIPAIHQPGARMREWRPWPGEQIALAITRPAGVEGPTATLDRASLRLRPGLRSTDAELELALRSSRGGQHVVTLPEGAELLRASLDGAELPLRPDGRVLALPIHPGSQSIGLAWREPRGARALLYRSSALDLGLPTVNAEIAIEPSPARWTLLTGGPRLGPAVLFWPLLLVVAIAALALARFSQRGDLTPLRLPQWLGLGIGLTQVPIALAAIVALWLLALGWRGQRGTRLRGAWFDLLQLALAGLTLLALGILFRAIEQGLLGAPSMQIAGNGSSASLLRWYQDRSSAALPRPWLLSVPLWVYRAAMLAWALWLASALLGWLRWGWSCFSAGELWRPLRRGRVGA